MTTKKGVEPISYASGGVFGINELVMLGTTQGQVVTPTSASVHIVGVSQQDSTASGQSVAVATKPGERVICRCGAGGVTGGDSVGADGTDYAEIATITLAASGTTYKQRIGKVDAPSSVTFVSNEEVPVVTTYDLVLI